jgi:hypothetical protein
MCSSVCVNLQLSYRIQGDRIFVVAKETTLWYLASQRMILFAGF